MANHSLTPLTPLGHDEPIVSEIGNARIEEVVDRSLASIAQRDGKARKFIAAAKRAFKTKLPTPGKSLSKGEFTIFWSSPDQWFVEAPMKSHEDIAAILTTEFEESASVTEQTGGWCRFDVSGTGSVGVLERLSAVDSAIMATNAATRSVMEHIGVFILCRKAGTHFSVYGPRSSAGSLYHALTTSAKSVA